ncbi:MAG: type II secretion system F family protein [Dialister sp.]|nr:type II secretion system F family protein [Dialister sp.]
MGSKSFSYKVFTDDGRIREGHLNASSDKVAAEILTEQGLHLITLAQEGRSFFALPSLSAPFMKRKKLALLAREWASLLSAGITVTDALSLLAGHENGRGKHILESIQSAIESGRTVSDCFKDSGAFPPFFTAMLHVGEVSGTMPEQLARLSSFYKKEEYLISRFTLSLAYPAFVLLFALTLSILILTFILPSFSMLFTALNIPFPPATAAALSAGLFLKTYGASLLVFLLLLCLFLSVWSRSESGRRVLEQLLFSSSFVKQILLIRFCFTLSALLESGTPLSDSLDTCAEVIGNHRAASAIRRVKRSVTAGGDFSRSLAKGRFSTSLLSHMISVGMESGQLPFFLSQSGTIMTDDLTEKIRKFRAVLEPSLLLLVGIMTGCVLYTVMLPIFTAAGSRLSGM